MTNLDNILKSRDINLPPMVLLIKAMVFQIVMYGYEIWTIKIAECQRIDAFELWCWRRLLRNPWTTRRSNQSILKEISPEYSLKGLMLKVQYVGHLMQRTDPFEKNVILGKKVMINLFNTRISKSRDITLPTKVCLVKTMVFPVAMCGCESWTVKKAKC